MFENINDLIEVAQKSRILRMAVAAAGDEVVLSSVKKADQEGIIQPILIGNEEKIHLALKKNNYNYKGRIIPAISKQDSAIKTFELIANGEADFPMKGLLNTKTILKVMLDKKYGLRQDRLLSFVSLICLEKDNRMVILTDGGMNIKPDLQQKVEIINNAVEMAQVIGIETPKVAPLAAVEMVNPDMPATVDAALLSKMSDRGQIRGAIVDGPLAFDNAISIDAAKHKGIKSNVAGKADILLAPDIEAGNILYKSLVIYSKMKSASIVSGAKIPMVITSRADRADTKFNSIALGKIVTLGLINK